MKEIEELKIAVSNGGNMVNFGRSLKSKNPKLYQWIIDKTEFLDECSINERVYCIMNNITSRPLCPISNKPLKFDKYFTGYLTISFGARADENNLNHIEEITPADIGFLEDLAENKTFERLNFRTKYPQLYLRIMATTPNFGNAKVIERIYCILHGIKERPKKAFGKGHFFYDLVIPRLKICIEYQSKAFHPNPNWDSDTWSSWRMPFKPLWDITPDEKYEYDTNKARILFKNKGIRTWFVWEETVSNDVDEILFHLKSLETIYV